MTHESGTMFGMAVGGSDYEPGNCPECGRLCERPYCPHDGQLIAPFSVGNYVVEETLGTGGMGLVFGGRHRLLGKPVAIKVLRDGFAGDVTQAERFFREARTAAALRHENIIDIYDFGRDQRTGALYLVMDRLWGRTVEDLIREEAPVPVERVVNILVQLCRAVGEAHRQGIVHRDLTPANVFLIDTSGKTDVVKLCDFGIARLSSGADSVTATGSFIGTPAYMAPEQMQGGSQDARVDVHALGVTAYEMLTGTLPFDNSTPVALIASKLTSEPQPVQEVQPDIPPWLADLVMSCLSRDPDDRPAGVRMVEERLLSRSVAEVDSHRVAKTMLRADALIGQTVGTYKILELLGTGGLGAVYLGEHPVIGTKAAVKVLKPEVALMEDMAERFVQEAKAANQIESPHIPRYFDFGKLDSGQPFAIMEYVPGQTLAERLEVEQMSTADIVELIKQVAETMEMAHAVGIVHRDLKPENLILERRPDNRLSVKVLDFGIAKLLEPSET